MPSTATKDITHAIKTVLPIRTSHEAALPMESGRSRSWYSFHMAPVHRHSVTKNSRPNRHVVVEGMIVSGIRSEPQEPVEVICILGGGLHGDQPTVNLRNRLIAGMEAMEEYPEAQVIVCGGQGSDEPLPEAEAMYNWMTANGADASRITRETASRDTIQNIQNAMAICEQKGWDTRHVTVVSSRFHLFRIRHIMVNCGLTPSVIGAPEGNPAACGLMYIREYFSVVKLILRGCW